MTGTAPAGIGASATMSVAPVSIDIPGRGLALHMRVSAPLAGEGLPIILFSHGYGQSLRSYGPLVDHWAAAGFAVIQPTHLDSSTIGLPPTDPRTPGIWRYREDDLVAILDNLATVEQALPALAGRLDHQRIAVAGHSWGATTASTLLGATHPDPADGSTATRMDPRVKAGVLLAIAGHGGASLTPFAATHFAFMNPDFSAMETPALIVAGDADQSLLSTVGPQWWREAYDFSPGRKALFTAFGGEHSLGGISDYGARETTDENPDRVAAIRQLSVAFLNAALGAAPAVWDQAVAAVESGTPPQGRVESK